MKSTVEVTAWRRRARLSLCVFGLGLTVGRDGLVRAADTNQSPEALLRRGVDLRTEGKDEEALAIFKKAAALSETPKVRAQIGLAELALGLWVSAETDLAKGLAASKNPWIANNRATLDGAMKNIRAHLADLAVWGKPDGAEVLVNGRSIGTLPSVSVRLQAEQVVLQVRHDGYLDLQRTLSVSPGDRLREHVELAPLRSLPTAVVLAPKAEQGSTTLVARSAEPSPQESAPVYARWWFWTGVGVVIAGGVAGAYLATRKSTSGPDCGSGCEPWNQ